MKSKYIILGVLSIYILSGLVYFRYKDYQSAQEQTKAIEAHSQGQCYSQGKYYNVGDSFSAPDSCNVCHCDNLFGSVGAYCTEIGCPALSTVNSLDIFFMPLRYIAYIVSNLYNQAIKLGSRIFI